MWDTKRPWEGALYPTSGSRLARESQLRPFGIRVEGLRRRPLDSWVGPLARNDHRVGAWEQEPRLSVGESHQVGRLTSGTAYLDDFAVLIGMADAVSVNA